MLRGKNAGILQLIPSEYRVPQNTYAVYRLGKVRKGVKFATLKKATWIFKWAVRPEPVFLNVFGAQESIPRNEFCQPM